LSIIVNVVNEESFDKLNGRLFCLCGAVVSALEAIVDCDLLAAHICCDEHVVPTQKDKDRLLGKRLAGAILLVHKLREVEKVVLLTRAATAQVCVEQRWKKVKLQLVLGNLSRELATGRRQQSHISINYAQLNV
jgi:hypothetical protein